MKANNVFFILTMIQQLDYIEEGYVNVLLWILNILDRHKYCCSVVENQAHYPKYTKAVVELFVFK